MKKIIYAFAAVLAAAAAPLGAQWTSFGTVNNDGSEFWDNSSTDGPNCNVGFVLNGTAGSLGNPCDNQRPAGWLPYTGSTPDQYFNSLFYITAGTYSFSVTGFGDVAGQNLGWGYWDGNHATTTNLGSSFVGGNVFAGNWGLWIDLTNGSRAYSDTDWQFAAFGFSSASGNWIFGFEDICVNAGSCGSDKDYNDVFLAISGTGGPEDVIPEPATMTLLATGLAGMAAASRRRRTQKK